jgi:catechol-2,3-dioxygenase
MAPSLDRVDHIHVFVTDRAKSERWYAQVMGLARVPELARWAADGGPLTLSDASGKVHLALFERSAQPCRSTIALGVSASEFMAWRKHLSAALAKPIKAEDHEVSWSLYFSDPDGNPYEITTDEYGIVAKELESEGA